MMLLGRKTAAERIASFLLEMAGRVQQRRRGLIELPMSRTDMADYLGLTIETVCRGLTRLRRNGTIADRTGRDRDTATAAPSVRPVVLRALAHLEVKPSLGPALVKPVVIEPLSDIVRPCRHPRASQR